MLLLLPGAAPSPVLWEEGRGMRCAALGGCLGGVGVLGTLPFPFSFFPFFFPFHFPFPFSFPLPSSLPLPFLFLLSYRVLSPSDWCETGIAQFWTLKTVGFYILS